MEIYRWLAALYHAKKLSLRKIMRLFGHKSEKQRSNIDKKKNGKNSDGSSSTGKNGDDKKKGHGRRGKEDFPGAKKEFHELDSLKKGDSCPECPLGKLYPVTPGTYIHFTGHAPLQATIHETEKLRCNACGAYFEAELKEELKEKYHPSSDVAVATQKYALGLPFYRMGRWQDNLGIPLSASTQWERCENLVNSIYPVYRKLLEYASDGELIHGDDTGGRILDVEKEEKKKGKNKRNVWTTGIVSRTKWGTINLFFTKTQHCGQNMDDLLKMRKEESAAIFMSDAAIPALEKSVAKYLKLLGVRNFVLRNVPAAL